MMNINRMKRLLIIGLSLIVVLGTACGSDFPNPHELTDENLILAIAVTPPISNGGEEVFIEALSHWPEGSPSYLWILCIPDPSTGLWDTIESCVSNHFNQGDVLESCDNLSSTTCILNEGVEATASLMLPPDLGISEGDEFFVFIEMIASSQIDVMGHCESAIQEGIPEPDCLISLTRLRLTGDATVTNVNAELMPLTMDGVVLDATEPVTITTASVFFEIDIDVSTVDEVAVAEPGRPLLHNLDLAIYTDCGHMKYNAEKENFDRDGPYTMTIECENDADGSEAYCETKEDEWVLDSSGECVVYFVLRDNSGGSSYRVQHFIVDLP
jgi:hypothetical protein